MPNRASPSKSSQVGFGNWWVRFQQINPSCPARTFPTGLAATRMRATWTRDSDVRPTTGPLQSSSGSLGGSVRSCMLSKCYSARERPAHCSLRLRQANCRRFCRTRRRSWALRPLLLGCDPWAPAAGSRPATRHRLGSPVPREYPDARGWQAHGNQVRAIRVSAPRHTGRQPRVSTP
jgi:hypothetical protein